jgi:hypothetical protein
MISAMNLKFCIQNTNYPHHQTLKQEIEKPERIKISLQNSLEQPMGAIYQNTTRFFGL